MNGALQAVRQVGGGGGGGGVMGEIKSQTDEKLDKGRLRGY